MEKSPGDLRPAGAAQAPELQTQNNDNDRPRSEGCTPTPKFPRAHRNAARIFVARKPRCACCAPEECRVTTSSTATASGIQTSCRSRIARPLRLCTEHAND